jgi:hypothetical protein
VDEFDSRFPNWFDYVLLLPVFSYQEFVTMLILFGAKFFILNLSDCFLLLLNYVNLHAQVFTQVFYFGLPIN